MRWSLKIAEIAGTTLRVHVTFFLLLFWIAMAAGSRGGPAAAIDGVLFVILVFACVVLHEFGHAFAARLYGIRTPDITLLPIGGLARLERMPEKPGQELVVAAAGPAVNVVIAAVLMLVFGARFDFSEMGTLEAVEVPMIARLTAVNIILFLFNMIPAFPMDGGRMLRALLSTRFSRAKATRIAARAGQAFAIVFALIGLNGNPVLLLIAVFLFFAAEAESLFESERALAHGHVARDAMITRFQAVPPQATADDVARLLLLTTQQEFPVVDDRGFLRGLVTRQSLMETMQSKGAATPVVDFMDHGIVHVPETKALDEVLQDIATAKTRVVAVSDRDGRFRGYINAENLAELLMLDRARQERRARENARAS